jgi:hypothetical protein
LLVFDNCEEEALLDAWRPPSGGCRVLVTSRRSRWSPTLGVTALPLDLLPRPDSIELLRRYRPDLASDDPGLDAIAEELGDLPLALHLAGSYLRVYRTEVRLGDDLAALPRSDIVQHASLLGAGLDDSPSPTPPRAERRADLRALPGPPPFHRADSAQLGCATAGPG